VKPPAGWSVLWGDPAITTSRSNYNVVFMSNLAIPDAKMPAQGIDGSVIYGSGQSYIGGACIARSGRRHDVRHSSVCRQHRTDRLLGLHAGPLRRRQHGCPVQRRDFAAYVTSHTGHIDVWRSPSNNGQFARLPTPFPGLHVSHPRLRTAPLDAALYVAATVRYDKGYRVHEPLRQRPMGNPVRVSESVVLYPSIDFGTSVLGQPLTVRTGPQFSFDVGAPSENGVDGIRMLYTRWTVTTTSTRSRARRTSPCVRRCRDGESVPARTTGYRSTVSILNVAAWVGFIGLPPSWQGSYVYRYNKPATGVHLARLALGYVKAMPSPSRST
jgi:hypothetical protein